MAVELAPADQSTSSLRPEQVLTWSGEPTNVSDSELATIKRHCLPMAGQDIADTARMDPSMPDTIDPERLYPVFAERRTDFGAAHENHLRAMFLTDDYLVECSAYTTDSSQPRAEDVAGSASNIRPIPDMGPSEQFSNSWDTNSIGFMLPVPTEAASVKFFIGGGYVEGTINNGIAVAWFSAEGVEKKQDSVGFAVYDDDGERIGGTAPVPEKTWPTE